MPYDGVTVAHEARRPTPTRVGHYAADLVPHVILVSEPPHDLRWCVIVLEPNGPH